MHRAFPSILLAPLILLLSLEGAVIGAGGAASPHFQGVNASRRETPLLITGRIVAIHPEKREIELIPAGPPHSPRGSGRYTIAVDDPARLKGLKVGSVVKVRVERNDADNVTFSAREIAAPGWRCPCDPTGVRGRMRRARRNWGCSRGCCGRR